MVSTAWMPATSPTWVASSWAALMTPYSDSASSLDMVAEVAGMRDAHAETREGQGDQDDEQSRRRA